MYLVSSPDASADMATAFYLVTYKYTQVIAIAVII